MALKAKKKSKKQGASKSKFSHPDEVEAIVAADHGNPFAFLGMHEIEGGGGVVVDRKSVV